MFKKSILIGLIPLIAQSSYAQEPVRTQASSALRVLIQRQKDITNQMPMFVEDGADIAYTCATSMFMEWGDKVYGSVQNTPDAQDPPTMQAYINVRDDLFKSNQVILEGRKDMPRVVKDIIKEYRDGAQIANVPAELNFANFIANENQYLNSLAVCIDPQYLQRVSSLIAPLEEDLDVYGGNTGSANLAGGNGSAMVMVGMVAVSGQQIVLTDKSAKFRKTKKYSEWIQTFLMGQ